MTLTSMDNRLSHRAGFRLQLEILKTCGHSGMLPVLLSLSFIVVTGVGVLARASGVRLHQFTVADGIGVAHFGDPYMLETRAITGAPNGKYVAVEIERGVLKTNRVEDELRIYSMEALRICLESDTCGGSDLRPLWAIRESTYSVGPLIRQVGWLRNSSGVTFLLTNGSGQNQLVVGLIKCRTINVLTPQGQDVTAFDVGDLSHYAYTIRAKTSKRAEAGDGMPSVDVAGRSLYDLLFPPEEYPGSAQWRETRSVLWAATGGAPRPVLNPETHKAVVLFQQGQWAMRLAPDGRTLETVLPVLQVPLSWQSQYPPAFKGSPFAIHAGRQSREMSRGEFRVGNYVSIDLRTGRILPLTGAPTGASAGWWGAEMARGAWARNGKAVILPGTFVPAAGGTESRPCVAVVMIPSKRVQCVVHLRSAQGVSAEGYLNVDRVRFVGRDDRRIVVEHHGADERHRTTVFSLTVSGRYESSGAGSSHRYAALNVAVREGLNQSPVLVVANPVTHMSRVVWNPNPQLKDVALGKASVYHWEDRTGRRWTGGLYESADGTPRRYPLIIQTHGFSEEAFRPSGVIPTAFAARSLAAAGIVVLQVPFCKGVMESIHEIPCQLAGYESAVRRLSEQGIIDPQRVGIIGFSRTVSYVMAALTDPRLQFQAASVTDGVDDGYLQYMTSVDLAGNILESDADAVIGARPFGSGLEKWFARSPEFNLDKIEAPLLVVSGGITRMLSMWGPYAGLRLLHKPVDMIILNTEEHVLTNPAERVVSQGGAVDWFRFWLQGYESAHPVMAGEYRRWEKLCDIQKAQNPSRPRFCVPTPHVRASVPMRQGHVG